MAVNGGKEDMGISSVRSLEEVEEFLEHAKLKSTDLLPEKQILYFGDEVHDYKLLELNPEILDALKEGQTVVFRGSEGKKAVLCTDKETFELLEAETSNSSLLVPDLNINLNDDIEQCYLKERTIDCVFFSYYELRKIKQHFVYELLTVLNQSLYNGKENEVSPDERPASQRLYTISDLSNICQASTKEMEIALKSIDACNINGYWRLLKFDYHLRVFTQLLNLAYSNSWPIDGIPEEELLEGLNYIFPEVIVRHIISLYLEFTYERRGDGEPLYRFNEGKVCRFLAEALLRDGEGVSYDLERFTEAWRSSVPEGLNADLNQLSGLAVVVEEDNTKLPQIKLCSERELPKSLPERVEQLFAFKKKWTHDELTPYIKPLLPEKGNIRAAIMKYAQESTLNGVKVYSSKLK